MCCPSGRPVDSLIPIHIPAALSVLRALETKALRSWEEKQAKAAWEWEMGLIKIDYLHA